MLATDDYTTNGADSTNARSPTSWPTSRSPVNWPGGAGHWPPSTNSATTELDRSRSVDGEVGELDLRYSYEQQQHSPNTDVTPVPREQPPFAPNHRLAVPNPRISV